VYKYKDHLYLFTSFISSLSLFTTSMNSTVQVQPISQGFMSSSKNLSIDEKSYEYSQQQQLDGLHGCRHTHSHTHHGECENAQSSHRGCHTARLRALLVPAAVLAVFLTGLAAWLCFSSMMAGDTGLMEGLFRRAVDDGSSNGDSPFVKNKLYLIVILVGLFVVVILAIMLSFWCCKGAFENPLCCPCYLCACCGGLACLECIGCGLCAEGVDQL
jgi:hypothetical protein